MLEITQEEYDKTSTDFKGVLTREVWEFRGRDFPEEWIGKRTLLKLEGNKTVSLIEGISFKIK